MENNCDLIPFDRQRLLFNNQILQPDNSPIYWIAGVGANCKIHLGAFILNRSYQGEIIE